MVLSLERIGYLQVRSDLYIVATIFRSEGYGFASYFPMYPLERQGPNERRTLTWKTTKMPKSKLMILRTKMEPRNVEAMRRIRRLPD